MLLPLKNQHNHNTEYAGCISVKKKANCPFCGRNFRRCVASPTCLENKEFPTKMTRWRLARLAKATEDRVLTILYERRSDAFSYPSFHLHVTAHRTSPTRRHREDATKRSCLEKHTAVTLRCNIPAASTKKLRIQPTFAVPRIRP